MLKPSLVSGDLLLLSKAGPEMGALKLSVAELVCRLVMWQVRFISRRCWGCRGNCKMNTKLCVPGHGDSQWVCWALLSLLA